MDIKETIAGGLAGFSQALTGHPFDTLKVNMQLGTGNSSMVEIVQRIVKQDGIMGLYKAYGGAKRFLGEETRPLTRTDFFTAGFIAGTFVALVEGPVDLFKCQLQMRPEQYNGFVDATTKIVKERGLTGAYRGIVPTLIRNGPANAMWYGVYEYTRELQVKAGQTKNDLAKWRVMVSGGIGGIAYWLCCYPVDLVKSTMQSDHMEPSKRIYSGTIDTFSKIYKAHGMGGFTRGIVPCLLRAFPANGAAFVTYDTVLQNMNNRS